MKSVFRDSAVSPSRSDIYDSGDLLWESTTGVKETFISIIIITRMNHLKAALSSHH